MTPLPPASVDGDDLAGADPHLGDRDRRSDARQALLDTVLAASDTLVVIRDGRDPTTNQPLPPATVVADLTDAIVATITADAQTTTRESLELTHPRQRFDLANFATSGSAFADAQPGVPWSFDSIAMSGALALTDPTPATEAPTSTDTPAPTGMIDLADLHDFLEHPPRYFLRRVLELDLPRPPESSVVGTGRGAVGANGLPAAAPGADLVLELDGLERWALRHDWLRHRLGGGEAERFGRRAMATGALPPGRLSQPALDDLNQVVDPLVAEFEEATAGSAPTNVPVDITLADGTRVVGSCVDHGGAVRGPVQVTVSQQRPTHFLAAWLDLLALMAHAPDTEWRSVPHRHEEQSHQSP